MPINSLLKYWASVCVCFERYRVSDWWSLAFKNCGMLESLRSRRAFFSNLRNTCTDKPHVGYMCDRLHQPTIHISVAHWHSSPTCVLQGEASLLSHGLLRLAVVDISVIRPHYLLQQRKKQQRRGQLDQHCVLDSALPFPTKIRQCSAVYVPVCVRVCLCVCARVCVRVHLGTVISAAVPQCLISSCGTECMSRRRCCLYFSEPRVSIWMKE